MAEKNEVLKLDWMGRQSKHSVAKTDVSIAIYASKMRNEERNDINITFRNGLGELFRTHYISVAIWKNRLFFRATDKEEGIKLVQRNSEKNHYARIGTEAFVKKLLVFEGDYELKYDDFYEMYYIENENLNK